MKNSFMELPGCVREKYLSIPIINSLNAVSFYSAEYIYIAYYFISCKTLFPDTYMEPAVSKSWSYLFLFLIIMAIIINKHIEGNSNLYLLGCREYPNICFFIRKIRILLNLVARMEIQKTF